MCICVFICVKLCIFQYVLCIYVYFKYICIFLCIFLASTKFEQVLCDQEIKWNEYMCIATRSKYLSLWSSMLSKLWNIYYYYYYGCTHVCQTLFGAISNDIIQYVCAVRASISIILHVWSTSYLECISWCLHMCIVANFVQWEYI